ncbi:hypothetical protein C8Q77DRAFT_751055 [Trametes polyzona]|nr:hypothetical protein C8Q77DRAFT_751055 [Trametes polyzona]
MFQGKRVWLNSGERKAPETLWLRAFLILAPEPRSTSRLTGQSHRQTLAMLSRRSQTTQNIPAPQGPRRPTASRYATARPYVLDAGIHPIKLDNPQSMKKEIPTEKFADVLRDPEYFSNFYPETLPLTRKLLRQVRALRETRGMLLGAVTNHETFGARAMPMPPNECLTQEPSVGSMFAGRLELNIIGTAINRSFSNDLWQTEESSLTTSMVPAYGQVYMEKRLELVSHEQYSTSFLPGSFPEPCEAQVEYAELEVFYDAKEAIDESDSDGEGGDTRVVYDFQKSMSPEMLDVVERGEKGSSTMCGDELVVRGSTTMGSWKFLPMGIASNTL